MSSLDKYTVNMHLQLHEQVLRVVFLTLIIYNECTWNLPWAVIFTSTLSCGRKKKSWRIIYEPAYFCVLSWEDFFFVFPHHSVIVSVRAQFSAIYNLMHVWRVLWLSSLKEAILLSNHWQSYFIDRQKETTFLKILSYSMFSKLIKLGFDDISDL